MVKFNPISERIETKNNSWHYSSVPSDLIYEWVKTGLMSKRDFQSWLLFLNSK